MHDWSPGTSGGICQARVVTLNMEGRGGHAHERLYNAAPKDGTAFGTVSRARRLHR